MENIVRRDILKIFEKVIGILETRQEQDYSELKTLSNHTIHNSSIFQDEDSISTAVIVYSIAKLIDRGIPEHTYNMIFVRLVSCKELLQAFDKTNFRKKMKEIFKIISRCDEKLSLYVQDVISQAMMKKAGKIYQHGLSAGIVAEIMGISPWDFLQYIGSTSIIKEEYDPQNIRKRLNFARELFGTAE
ncbi:MAG: hypothetical protein KAI26_01690 [Nanoarchaeota archaeon]|nr:hypothetical protein [Nanoarchaeota archaeon]